MQAVAGGIEAAIERDRAASEARGERIRIGAVGHQAAPLEIFEEGHGRKGQRVSESAGAVNGSTPPARKRVSYEFMV